MLRHRLPRTRGDGPASANEPPEYITASPHTRGWTVGDGPVGAPRVGFPAHAGMDPQHARRMAREERLPRTRGDGPSGLSQILVLGEASPHTRGWTSADAVAGGVFEGFPAHAGMDPLRSMAQTWSPWLPRTRGDGPRAEIRHQPCGAASPHTRGWTFLPFRHHSLPYGFPAHAGMDPSLSAWRCLPAGLPRTRGDGPWAWALRGCAAPASPHTRGWTHEPLPHVGGPGGFPAHAGMDPVRGCSGRRRRWLPRTRGDGPCPKPYYDHGGMASPHTRGWTPEYHGA